MTVIGQFDFEPFKLRPNDQGLAEFANAAPPQQA